VRPQTRREHRPLVRQHAEFRTGGRAELETLAGWLTEQALEHDRPSLLLGEFIAELRRRRIDRPPVDRLMRLVASACERAHEQTFQRLASQLTSAVRVPFPASAPSDAAPTCPAGTAVRGARRLSWSERTTWRTASCSI
jgi:hypothetical protein